MHYYQFNIGDYASHTRHLDPIEDLIYRRLLDLYYLHERPLNSDATTVAKQIGLRDEAAGVRDVLNEFFEHTDDGYRSVRADKEIENYRAMSEGGKRGAAKRWSKGGDSPPITTPMASLIATNNQEPITNNHKPKKEKKATVVARPVSIDEQLWNDWLVIRKKKDAPLTETAWELFVNQVEKSGWTIEDAIKECCLRTWASFKAEWVAPKQTYAQQAADIARVTVPGSTGPDPALQKIAEDRKNAAPMPEHIRAQINSVLRKVG